MRTIVYIVTHKQAKIPSINGFEPLLVGANKNKSNNCYQNCDNTGENISDKNKNYCELTAVYWIWKNINVDVTGICHYRRFFTKAFFSTSEKWFLSKKDIEKILETYDVIVPKAYFYKKSIIESVNIAPNKADMNELEKAIKETKPEYYETYLDFINGKQSYLYNMVIMRKSLFDDYCEWLFDILFFIEKDYDISHEDEYRSRLFGFLSERLLAVWLNKNVDKNKIKECRVIKTDETAFRSKLHDLKNSYRKIYGYVFNSNAYL